MDELHQHRNPDLLYIAVGERLADVLDVARVIRSDPASLDAKTIGRLADIMVTALEQIWGFMGLGDSTAEGDLPASLQPHVIWKTVRRTNGAD